MPLTEKYNANRSSRMLYAALTLAVLSVCLSLFSLSRPLIVANGTPTGSQPSLRALERIKKTGVMRVGYGGFPPYTIVDPKQSDPNKRVGGFCVDMVGEIANRYVPPLRIEWYNLDWDTFRADMLSGKFDFLADAVYDTIPKAADFGMTDPFSYFGIAAAVVSKTENRFHTFQDLDRPGITIALAQGWTSTDYAQQHLTKPTFKMVTVGKDAYTQLDDVLFGRADVALNDVPTVVQYVKAHRDKVKALWVDNPPSSVPASFVTRREDWDLLAFLNTSIRILKVDGTLERLDKKWNSLGHFEKLDLIPGAGLAVLGQK